MVSGPRHHSPVRKGFVSEAGHRHLYCPDEGCVTDVSDPRQADTPEADGESRAQAGQSGVDA